mgnify:CR=1 FL=1
MPKPKWHLSPSGWRRGSQLLFLAVILSLFLRTDYSGGDELNQGVNLLFRLDPLLALAVTLAAKTVSILFLPAVLVVLLTLLLGRFFCGWFCPMGTMIDWSRHLAGAPHAPPEPGQRHWKYALLLFLLAASLFGLPLAGYLDPFSLLIRGLTFAVQPAVDYAATTFFTWTYQSAPGWINSLTEPVYDVLKRLVLPSSPKLYTLSLFSLGIFLTVLGLSVVESRFFCRKVCPLGALLASLARFSLMRISGGSPDCGSCQLCRNRCRMGAIGQERAIASPECILCLDCLSQCPRSRIHYGFARFHGPKHQPNLSRRAVIGSIAAGALAPLALPARPLARHPEPTLIRPPGAIAEPLFLAQCVRCGECMKVCIGNALHATWLEAGLEGMFSPRLIGRIGYCEFNCTLCGQVCPTGAIQRLAKTEKQQKRIGLAFFDTARCLPYAAATPCIVCEEHCPTPNKAIQYREVVVKTNQGQPVTLRQPYVMDELCIGCGICENKCPLPGAAAIRITAAGESRHADRAGAAGYGQ